MILSNPASLLHPRALSGLAPILRDLSGGSTDFPRGSLRLRSGTKSFVGAGSLDPSRRVESRIAIAWKAMTSPPVLSSFCNWCIRRVTDDGLYRYVAAPMHCLLLDPAIHLPLPPSPARLIPCLLCSQAGNRCRRDGT